jgi:hypothetical protein
VALRLSRVLEIVSSVTQIASYFGLPFALAGGVTAGLFAWTKELGAFASLLVVLFVITSLLQCFMATIFLVDRLLERRRQTEEENRAIAYHLAPVGALMSKDEANPNAEFQLRVHLVNTSGYPLGYEVISTRAVIDDRETPVGKANYVPGVLPVGGMTSVRFNSYAKDRLPRSGLLRGRMEMTYRYGHASRGFVFESHRLYNLKCDLREEASSKPGEENGAFPVELVTVSENDVPLPRRTL